MEIRRAVKADIFEIEKLENSCFSEPWSRYSLECQISAEGKLMLVAEENGKIIGFAALQFVLDEGSVANVCTDPKHRMKGVADRMLKRLLEEAKRLKLSFLTLEVRKSNAAAIGLYEKNGYSVVGKRKNYYDNPLEDAILMTLFLN